MSLLGIDIGTTGIKAIAFNEEGKKLADSYREYELVYPRPYAVEFDTIPMWDNIFDAIREINSSNAVKKDPVAAISASTIGESFTPLDERGNIIHNTIYSTDSRSRAELDFIFTKIPSRSLYSYTGLPPQAACALNKILWLKNNLPGIYKKTRKILFTEDLLQHKLGISNTKISYALSSTTLFFDIRKKIWQDEILNTFDIDKNLFSAPSPSGEVAGIVRSDIAENLGFKNNVYVVTGGHDQQCAALGVGSIEGGLAADGMGTVECVTTTLDELIVNDLMHENNFSTRAHVIPDKFVTFAYNFTSGSLLEWFIKIFAEKEKVLAAKENINVIKYFFKNFDYDPSGLFVLPYFSQSGTPYHDPIPRGTITGLNLATGKEEIFKAIIEGLIFEIAFNIELIEKSGIKITELRAVGGGSRSDKELALKSSILGKPIKRMKTAEAGCLAAMMLAGSAVNKFTIGQAISNFIEVDKEFYPDDKVREKYSGSFKSYKKIYNLVKDIC
jgi:xylulokinase